MRIRKNYQNKKIKKKFVQSLVTYVEIVRLHVLYALHMLNLVQIWYYLLYDSSTYFLYIILNFKNLQFKQFINEIIIDL